MEIFGCDRCWTAGADECYEAIPMLAHQQALIDDSHLRVGIRSCSHCQQRFLLVFSESIDWSDGEDPQCWTLMPITKNEASVLVEHGSSATEATLNALGIGRRSLRHDWPKATPPLSYWVTGVSIASHD